MDRDSGCYALDDCNKRVLRERLPERERLHDCRVRRASVFGAEFVARVSRYVKTLLHFCQQPSLSKCMIDHNTSAARSS